MLRLLGIEWEFSWGRHLLSGVVVSTIQAGSGGVNALRALHAFALALLPGRLRLMAPGSRAHGLG